MAMAFVSPQSVDSMGNGGVEDALLDGSKDRFHVSESTDDGHWNLCIQSRLNLAFCGRGRCLRYFLTCDCILESANCRSMADWRHGCRRMQAISSDCYGFKSLRLAEPRPLFSCISLFSSGKNVTFFASSTTMLTISPQQDAYGYPHCGDLYYRIWRATSVYPNTALSMIRSVKYGYASCTRGMWHR